MESTAISRRDFSSLAVGGSLSTLLSCQAVQADSPDVTWLADIQSPPPIKLSGPGLAPLLLDANGMKIETLPQWRLRRTELLSQWRAFLGSSPERLTAVPQIELVSEDLDAGVLRQLIRYSTEPGETVEAYLLKPLPEAPIPPDHSRTAQDLSKRPGLVVYHSTVKESIRQPAGIEGAPEKAFGLRFAKRGYTVICPRNYLWPETTRIAAQAEAERFQQRHPSSKGMQRMLHDAFVATDILAAQPEVDRQRIGVIGHSLGAKEVLYHAAFDERVRVAVSSEGGIGPTFSNWDALWYLSDAVKQPNFRLDHHMLLAAVAPRAFLLIGGDSADGDQSWPYIESVLPVYRLYGERGRIGLFNHKQGHAVPPSAEVKIDEWVAAYL